jgi:hypothetical protein
LLLPVDENQPQTMLGIDKNRPPVIEGKYAEEMREAIRRKYANQPSELDKQANARSKQIKSEYNAVWK